MGQLSVGKNMKGIHELDKKLRFNQWFPKGWSNEAGQFVMKFTCTDGKMRRDKVCMVSFQKA